MLTYPEHSFYILESTTPGPSPSGYDGNCAANIIVDQCIPIYNLDDISFQVFSDVEPVSDDELFIIIYDNDGNSVARPSGTWGKPVWTEMDNGGGWVGTVTFTGNMNHIRTAIGTNNCFKIGLTSDDGDDVYISINCFRIQADTCYTTRLSYRCNENTFSFNYEDVNFLNTVRLPFYYKFPKTKSKRIQYRKSDGDYIKLSSVMSKEYTCKTEWMNDEFHTKIAVALEHDTVKFDGNKVIMQDDDYDVKWDQDEIDYPYAPAEFKINSMPFHNTNSNC